MDISVFAVLGGDKRSAILASLLAADGYTVYASGFDREPGLAQCAVLTDAATAVSMSQAVVLPVVPVRPDSSDTVHYLNTPLSDKTIPLDSALAGKLEKKKVYSGFCDRIRRISPEYAALMLYDYGNEESFLLPNARLTAEAALMLAISEYPAGLYDCGCVITGFGRIGKALAHMLYSLGADVTVCARKPADIALAAASGYNAINYTQLPAKVYDADIIFNTADAPVISENIIGKMNTPSLIIELASAPGGTDGAAAESRGIKVLWAWGLPGKYSPLTAAKIIKDTVLAMTGGENT